jgi:hypothetical protein
VCATPANAVMRRAGWVTVLALISGCASVSPTVVPSARVASLATRPAPTDSHLVPSESPSPVTPTGAPLVLLCTGELVRSTMIDYANDSPGVADILAATRTLRGVKAADLVVMDGNSTFVIRDTQVIWRGDWFNMGHGFLLGTSTACSTGGQIGP